MLDVLLNYTFMQNAFLAALLASITAALIGSMIVEKHLISMSGGIAHSAFGGIGLGYLLGIEPIIGGLVFAVASSLSVRGIQKRTRIKSDTLIGIFWSTGMAFGILFISLASGYFPDMTTYLFGDILTVSSNYIIYIAILTVVCMIVIIPFFNYWKAYLFDEEYARTRGINTRLLDYLLFILIPVGIIILVKVVGIILAIALFTIPPSVSKIFFNKLKTIMIASVGFGVLFCITGIYLSFTLNIPSGACIIILSAAVYFTLSLSVPPLRKALHRVKHRKH